MNISKCPISLQDLKMGFATTHGSNLIIYLKGDAPPQLDVREIREMSVQKSSTDEVLFGSEITAKKESVLKTLKLFVIIVNFMIYANVPYLY